MRRGSGRTAPRHERCDVVVASVYVSDANTCSGLTSFVLWCAQIVAQSLRAELLFPSSTGLIPFFDIRVPISAG